VIVRISEFAVDDMANIHPYFSQNSNNFYTNNLQKNNKVFCILGNSKFCILYKKKVKSKVVLSGGENRGKDRKNRPLGIGKWLEKKNYLDYSCWDLLDMTFVDGDDDEAFEFAIDWTVEKKDMPIICDE
jgi:hypothetical protein